MKPQKRYYCTKKQCLKEIEFQLKRFPTKELFMSEVRSLIYRLSETIDEAKSNRNQLRFWTKVLSILTTKDN